VGSSVLRKNVYIEKYDSILKTICSKKKARFIETFQSFKKENYEKLLEDGDHPNSKGHEKIFAIVRDFLVSEKII